MQGETRRTLPPCDGLCRSVNTRFRHLHTRGAPGGISSQFAHSVVESCSTPAVQQWPRMEYTMMKITIVEMIPPPSFQDTKPARQPRAGPSTADCL